MPPGPARRPTLAREAGCAKANFRPPETNRRPTDVLSARPNLFRLEPTANAGRYRLTLMPVARASAQILIRNADAVPAAVTVPASGGDPHVAAQGASYYERDGYYAKDDPEHRDASAWAGRGAQELGLKCPVPCIFLGSLHRAERAIAGCLLGIAAGNLPWPDIDPGKALPWVEARTGLALAPGQADAVRAALSSKVSVITGGPDVGKTTIINSILRILSAKDVDILLCAPTGPGRRRAVPVRRCRGAAAARPAAPTCRNAPRWKKRTGRRRPAS